MARFYNDRIIEMQDPHYHNEGSEATPPGPKTKLSRWKTRRVVLEGWKFTILLAFIASLVVLAFNVGFLIWAGLRPVPIDPSDPNEVILRDQGLRIPTEQNSQKKTLWRGDCNKVKRMSTGLHFLINILSTALLCASNFAMQCLSAPTRQDADRAHRKGKWLDVGVSSIRNLFFIPKKRALLWLCLAISSLPFHLLFGPFPSKFHTVADISISYNSVIFQATSANSYLVFTGPASFDHSNDADLIISDMDGADFSIKPTLDRMLQLLGTDSVNRLDTSQCVNEFATVYQTKYKSLLLVTDDTKNASTSLYQSVPVFQPHLHIKPIRSTPYIWICGTAWTEDYVTRDDCDSYVSNLRSGGNWSFDVSANTRLNIQYCLAEKAEQNCKLQYSLALTILIICMNLLKSSILCYMTFSSAQQPMMVVGDAISSYLHEQDESSQGHCLMNKRTAGSEKNISRRYQSTPKAQRFDSRQKLWGSAASGYRWTLNIIIWAAAISICTVLLNKGLDYVGDSSIWKTGISEVNGQTLIWGAHWPSAIISLVLIANAPQVVLSFIYFEMNSLLTTMCLSAEWSRHAVERKALRVSNNPRATQRSNYFLSLPYRYALPLIVASTVLHWLISQSLYLVQMEAYYPFYDEPRITLHDVVTCGYSPVAIVSAIAVGGSMFLCVIGLSFRRFSSAMPVAGSCSLAIAAACHPYYGPILEERSAEQVSEERSSESGEMAMEFLPLMWGALPLDGPVGHCTFSAEDLDDPVEGQMYQ